MKILITGSDGFVGRNYCKYFDSKNNVELTKIDIKSGNDCRDFFKQNETKFDLVIHLAAIVGGREMIEGEPISVGTDLSIDSEFFNWVLKTKQKKIIYFSSSAAYPKKYQSFEKKMKLKESFIDLDSIEHPDHIYGIAKLTGEILANFVKNEGVEVYTFRPFSGYGSDQDLSYPFPAFLNRVKQKVDTFEIWGNGEQVRDFIHIDDVVSATIKAVDVGFDKTVNLGWGIPISFNNLAEIFFKISKFYPKNGIQHLIDKPIGVEYRCADTSLMNEFFYPKFSLEHSITKILNE